MTTTNNLIAIVTGGNRGLGKSTAQQLAAQGVDVIFTYRQNVTEANAVVTQIEALGRRAVALHGQVFFCVQANRPTSAAVNCLGTGGGDDD